MKNKIALLSTAVASVAMTQSAFSAVLLSDSFDSSSVVTGFTFADLDGGNWSANGGTGWSISGGSIRNSGGDDGAGEGGFAQLINLTSLSDTSLNQLKLDINFSTVSTGENIYVHLRGFIGSEPAASTVVANLGAKNGASWDSTGTAFVAETGKINLNSGLGIGPATSNGTDRFSAVQVTSGASGEQSFSQTFDMSGYAVSDITGYDYLAVIVTRNGAAASGTEAIIHDITVSAVPEPSSTALLGLGGLSLILRRRR